MEKTGDGLEDKTSIDVTERKMVVVLHERSKKRTVDMHALSSSTNIPFSAM